MSAGAISASGLSTMAFASSAATQMMTTVSPISAPTPQTSSLGPTIDQDVLDRLAMGQEASKQSPEDMLKALQLYKPVHKNGKVGAVHVSQADIAMTLLLCALA